MGLPECIRYYKMENHFSPIVLALQMPTYSVTKFLEQLLKSLTVNYYTRKESSPFAEEVAEFQTPFFMTSFDVKSPCTNNIPLTKTLNRYVKNL